METKIFKVDQNFNKERVDKFLAKNLSEYSREFIKVLCKKNLVKVNNKVVQPDYRLSVGDKVEVTFPKREDYVLKKDISLEFVYEDEFLAVINKPAFLKVHPAKKFDEEVTLVDLLFKKIPIEEKENWSLERPFLVHRLDRETSGVLIIAKKPQTQFLLAKQFQQRQIKKVYRAICCGKLEVEKGEINAPIKKQKNLSKIHQLGKEAKTLFKVLSQKGDYLYLELYPITGRTHQIRTHLSFIGVPIIGDVKYNGSTEVNGKKVPRIMLHAYSIEFYHPWREKWLKLNAPLPEDFQFFLSYLSLE